MKKMVKLLLIPLGLMISGTTTSCSIEPKEIALITDLGDVNDGSFNQETWEGIGTYAAEFHKTYDFYRPFNDSEFARDCAIKQAVAKGAKFIALPGYKFMKAADKAQRKYPDVHFLLIDSAIEPLANLCCVNYRPEISGYMAGYSIASDYLSRDWNQTNAIASSYGYGYCGGMASPGVSQFGFGFIEGVCQGTHQFMDDHKITEWPNININFFYAGVYAQDDNATMKMKGWLASDRNIKAIFACGGKLYQSVTEACKEYNVHHGYFKEWDNENAPRDAARWVGVDADQYNGLSDQQDKLTIYTSALKKISLTVYDALTFHYNNQWDAIGGKSPTLGLDDHFGTITDHTYVGIPTATHKDSNVLRGFKNFTLDDYQKMEKPVKDKEIDVYPNAGEDYGQEFGYPRDIVNWEKDGVTFRKKYLQNIDKDKLHVDVQ